ncbi:MAG: LysM peptidoglycan-binding domain-containing protein [Chloroflexota bacterium]
MNKKNRTLVFGLPILFLVVVMATVSSCTMGTAPADLGATDTAIANEFAAALALAQTPTILVENTPTPTLTLDPALITLTPTATITPSPTITLLPTGTLVRPASYTLQKGEFPYCIARRYNVHPQDLMSLNGLTSAAGHIYLEGQVLQIPQTGRPFPTTRALRTHPTTYTVPDSQTTVYKVACYFGDVDPQAIMQQNGLTSTLLTANQVLQIP